MKIIVNLLLSFFFRTIKFYIFVNNICAYGLTISLFLHKKIEMVVGGVVDMWVIRPHISFLHSKEVGSCWWNPTCHFFILKGRELVAWVVAHSPLITTTTIFLKGYRFFS